MRSLFVYILKCSDNSYYTGISNDPFQRVGQHEAGIDPGCYTFSRRPLKLVLVEEYQQYHQALAREKQIKRWSRAKKEALINANWSKLQDLAQCRNESHYRNALK